MPKHPPHPRRQTAQSNTYRFFVASDAIRGRDGEQVTLLDNSGWQYVVALSSVERGRVAGTVERKELAGGEPRTKLTLYVALMRPERFEWVLQKGTELGASAFVPV